VTELAVIEPTDRGLVLREMAPGVTLDQIRAATAAKLIIGDDLREMDLGPWRAAPQWRRELKGRTCQKPQLHFRRRYPNTTA
jgi:acyl CoA:acetate/3-ketoacid CoA transferase